MHAPEAPTYASLHHDCMPKEFVLLWQRKRLDCCMKPADLAHTLKTDSIL